MLLLSDDDIKTIEEAVAEDPDASLYRRYDTCELPGHLQGRITCVDTWLTWSPQPTARVSYPLHSDLIDFLTPDTWEASWRDSTLWFAEAQEALKDARFILHPAPEPLGIFLLFSDDHLEVL